MDIGKKIALCRKEAGLSQEALAAELGISRQAVSRWETGEAVPDTAKVVELARLFSVTTDYLLLDNADKTNDTPTAENTSSISKKRVVFRILFQLLLLFVGGYMIYYSFSGSMASRGWIFALGVAVFFCGVYGTIVEYSRED